MKNQFAITFFLVTMMLPSWSEGHRVALDASVNELLTIIEQYQSQSHQRLNEYEKLMDEFYMTLTKEKQKVQLKNKEKLLLLEKKSANLRVRIESYKSGNDSDWSAFKLTTTRAIDAFGVQIENLEIEI